MKSLRRFGLFLASVFLFALAAPAFAVSTVVHAYRAAKELVLDGVAHALSLFKGEPRFDLNPVILLVQACAYATRLAKRERPRMESTWRMCPSA